MNEEDFSLCIGCSYSGWCANLAKILVAYECDAYAPEWEGVGDGEPNQSVKLVLSGLAGSNPVLPTKNKEI